MVMVFLSEFTGLEFGKKVFWVISGNKKCLNKTGTVTPWLSDLPTNRAYFKWSIIGCCQISFPDERKLKLRHHSKAKGWTVFLFYNILICSAVAFSQAILTVVMTAALLKPTNKQNRIGLLYKRKCLRYSAIS